MRNRAALVLAAIAGTSLPAMGETDDNNGALSECLEEADKRYKDIWKALCPQSGPGHCSDFVGTPREKEYAQRRIEEMKASSKLYDRQE
jgi:hypothetical protein